MKKRFILIIFAVAILFIILVAVFRKQVQQLPSVPTVVTPTPVTLPNKAVQSSVQLLSITPTNNEENVATTTAVQATFSQSADAISFSLYPEVPSTTNHQGNSLTITFSQPLAINTIYTYTFLDQQGKVIANGQFTTGQTSQSTAPLLQDNNNLQNTGDAYQQQNYPDVFLATYTPYQGKTFSVTSSFSDTTNQFTFTVSTSASSGKADFLSWLTSLGLSNEEIQRLTIQYQ